MVPVGNKQQRTSARECFKWVGKTTPPVTVSWIVQVCTYDPTHGSQEMQGVDNRGLVMGKLETAGGSHRMGGHLCQGVEGVVYI